MVRSIVSKIRLVPYQWLRQRRFLGMVWCHLALERVPATRLPTGPPELKPQDIARLR
jgi:hypothetical protein